MKPDTLKPKLSTSTQFLKAVFEGSHMNKIITLLISLIVCLAASSYAQENSTNAEPSKASESVKGSETPISSEAGLAKSLEPRGALKIKGLFIGQNVFGSSTD
jgi:L-lactate permease